MKKWVQGVWGIAIAASLFLGAVGTAFAHTMPEEEATLILPKPPVGQFEIVPHETTIGDLDAFGPQFIERRDFTGDGMRFVRCDVYNGAFIFLARTGAQDDRPASEMPIISYDVQGVSLHTPSNFLVSAPYEQVVAKYGEASYVLRNNSELVTYVYAFEKRMTELSFDVDAAGKICAIHYRSEM